MSWSNQSFVVARTGTVISLASIAFALLTTTATARTMTVTQSGDWGAGSLRQAIGSATAGDLIRFDPRLDGQPIKLISGQLILNKDVVIMGRGEDKTIIDGNFATRVFLIQDATVAISALTIRNGRADPPGTAESPGGGAILNDGGALTVRDCTFVGNSAGWYGGAIHNRGRAIVLRSSFIGNSADRWGGGIRNARGADLVVTDSTFSENSAGFAGGGIFNHVPATAMIKTSTFIDNFGWGYGGGIHSNGSMQLHSVTVTKGWSFYGGGGITGGAPLTMENSIIANQKNGGDCNNTVTSRGYNIDSDGSCGLSDPTDSPGIDPRLLPLDDNGGPTLTCALQAGSPAIDSGACGELVLDLPEPLGSVAVPLSRDQRGVTRPIDGDGDGIKKCDVGPFEFDPDRDDPSR